MSDFSIELAMGTIPDKRTRQYFEEVYRSYTGGNYRSAVVMLWSVIVCDILFKLEQVESIGDATAKRILNEINKKREKNPRSPDWERKLVEKVADDMHLLNEAERSNLLTLQDHRHLSAHPVLGSLEVLFTPNKDFTRAQIRCALEAVLTKPPIMTKKVFDALTEDLERQKDLFPSDVELEMFLESKYLPHFVPKMEDHIFRSLWKLVFKAANDRCENNRSINFRVLCILYDRRQNDYNSLISEDPVYYSDLRFSGTQIEYLIRFLGLHPEVFNVLSDSAGVPIRGYANASLDRFAEAWFLSPTLEDHVKLCLQRISDEEYAKLSPVAYNGMCSLTKSEPCYGKVLEIGIELYGRSIDFNAADARFEHFIEPYLNDYTEDLIKLLLDRIEANDQTYGRGRAKGDHRLVKIKVETLLGSKYDPTKYPGFERYLT